MLARLWWKEFRLFWPVWLFITLSALVAQWLALWQFGNDARTGVLMLVALGWAFLYAAAVSSSAFAGEREQRTLRFLDTLPVARDFLWRSKASFAIVTTLVFGLVLLLIGGVSTELGGKQTSYSPAESWSNFFSCLALLIETIGWGLFWSAIMGNALSAAAMTVGSVGVVVPLMMRQADLNPTWWSDAIGYRLGVAAVTMLASLLIVTRKPRSSPPPHRAARVREAEIRAPRAIPRRASKPPRFWLAATRALVWETLREMRLTLAIVIVAMVLVPFFFIVSGAIDPVIAIVIGVFAAVGAGINVFGAENRGKTYRFLAHQGAGPGVVWTVKMGLWSLAMLLVCIPAFALSMPNLRGVGGSSSPASPLILLGFWTYCFSAGQLCGMVIRRGITAGLVAFVLTLQLTLAMSALLAFGLLSGWELAAIPLGLILISRIWCVDWLLDRPGTRPWIKLGVSVIGVFGLIFAGYVWHRANEVPRLSPLIEAEVLSVSQPAPIPVGENAAPLYLEADRRFRSSDPAVVAEGRDLLRQASKLPSCRFTKPERETIVGSLRNGYTSGGLTYNFIPVIHESLKNGALDKAWSDILVLLRVARHLEVDEPISGTFLGLTVENSAMSLAVEWASDDRQTSDLIEQALKDLKALPAFPSPEDTIRQEWMITKQTIGLPKDRLRGIMETAFLDRLGGNSFFERASSSYRNWSAGMLSLAMTPWELERARRVLAELFAAKVLESRREPWRRIMPYGVLYNGFEHAYYPTPEATFYRSPWQLERDLQTSPIVKFLYSYSSIDGFLRTAERTEAVRRGLPQFLALRAWQLKHDGNLPEKLAEIVPSELDKLPVDPFSNKPFIYMRSQGEMIQPLDGYESADSQRTYSLKAEGRRLLMSVGENRQPLSLTGQYGQYNDDIVFVLPAAKNDPPIVPRIEQEPPENGAVLEPGMGAMMGVIGEKNPKEAKPEEKKDEAPEPKL